MMQMTPEMLVRQALQMNPDMANNQNAKAIIDAILNHDARAGAQMAQNMCQARGIDPMQTARQAQQAFMQRFQQRGGRR